MSASGDYDVSIVESFAPTKEWLPGQEVNKDVYATNTGSIAAMVKEEVNGRLAITYEADQAKWDAGCVELKDDEVYAVEDGSFLAYKPADSQKVVGTQIVTRPDDQSVPAAADFEPDTTGLYVFRRFIKVNADKTEEFEYDGYYYDANTGKYYKISNLQTYQDSHVADNTSGTWSFNDYWGDDADDDGVLMVASAAFRKEKTEYVDPVDLIYKELVAGDLAEGQPYAGAPEVGKYLIATFDRGNNTAMADAEAKAEAYDKAKHEYEYALALYNQALKEYNLAKTGKEDGSTGGTTGSDKAKADLDQAKQDLEDAMQNLETAQAEYDNALNEYNIALAAVTAAKKDYDESMTKLYGSATGSEASYTNDSLYGKYKAAQDAKAANGAYGDIAAEFNLWVASTPTPTTKSAYTALTTAELKTFRDWVDANVTDSELHKEYILTIDEQIAKVNYENEKTACLGTGTSYSDATAGYGKTYNDALSTYRSKYTALGDTSKNTEAANAGVANASLLSTDGGKKKALDDAKAAINTAKTGAQAVYDKALEDYEKALDKTEEAEALKDAAEALKEAATAVQTAAAAKYNAITDSTISTSDKDPLKIYIKLNDDAVITAQDGSTTNEMWYLNPQAAADGSLINDTAVFYYTGLLEGGETSAKLVDYVYLDKNTKANYYKNFDFDINVALKSAQINLDENGNIKTDAASELGQFAVYNGGVATDNADKVITWSDTQAVSPAPGDAVGTTYTANTVSNSINITKITAVTDSTDSTKTYQYSYSDGTDTYYGNSLASGATFTKGTISGTNVTLGTDTITLTSDAVKA